MAKTKQIWILIVMVVWISLAILYMTDRGFTFMLAIFQGSTKNWNKFEVPLNYSYTAVEYKNNLVVYKINAGFDGSDTDNTINISLNGEDAKQKIEKNCPKEETCVVKIEDNYSAVSVAKDKYEVFHVTDQCNALVYYQGTVGEYDKYKNFIRNFFAKNCQQ